MQQTLSRTNRREVHLRDYIIVIDRHKWLITAALLVTLSSTILYLRRQEPVYEARASIIIEPKRPQEIVFPQSVQAISLDLETQIEVIKTTPVLASVVRQVGLDTVPVATSIWTRRAVPIEAADQANVGTRPAVSLLQAVERLRRDVKIGFVKNTKMVTITARHSLPDKAQAIANAVAQAYIDQDRLSRLQSGRESVKWLSTQLADLKTKLRNSEEAFQKFKESEGMITLDDRRSEELQEISKINASYISARSSRLEVEAIISKLEDQGSTNRPIDLNIPIALLDSPLLQRLGAELSQLQTELADKRTLFKDTYPGVIELKERIQITEQKILAELRRQRDFLKAQEDSFLTQQETKREETLKLGRKELEYLTLEREATTNREMYNALLAKVKELSLAGEADLNNIRIVEPAELPMGPVGNQKLTLLLGGVLGLFLGIGFAFFLEYLENTIRTPDDVEEHLGLPILGLVPQIAAAKKLEIPILITHNSRKDPAAEAYRSLRTNLLIPRTKAATRSSSFTKGIGSSFPSSKGADSSFPRNEGANSSSPLSKGGQGGVSESGNLNDTTDIPAYPKTIVITSAGPGEGKSITVANLGMALAQAGQKVLLVDADLRRPILHRVFKADKSMGISTVLAGEFSVDEAIAGVHIPQHEGGRGTVPGAPTEGEIPRLSFLTSGMLPTNPSEMLGSAQMKHLISRVREKYDIVLFDSAPVLGITDTSVLAAETDGTVLVIEAGNATRKALKAAVAQLQKVGAEILGVVLNNADIKRDRYYDYYYYYYYSPYEHDEVSKRKGRKKRAGHRT